MSTIDNENSTATATVTPTIVIHGGAWAIPDSLVDASCNGVQNAAIAGYQVLTCEDDDGGDSSSSSLALDAVQAAVRVLEDDPAFDAGEFNDIYSLVNIFMKQPNIPDTEEKQTSKFYLQCNVGLYIG